MIPVREFASADEMKAHYRSVRSRLFPVPVLVPQAVEPAPAPEPEPEPRKPAPSLEEVLLQFREVYVVDAPDEHPKVRLIKEKREARRLVGLVADLHGLRPGDILGHSRERKMLKARHSAVALVATRFPAWSLPTLGRFFDRDHTTILHALRKAGLRT